MGSQSAARRPIRVAIVGVGNCAASLVQGVHYYRDADPAAKVPGLMHVKFGPYHVSDIEFVAAFDVDAKKVGTDLSAGDLGEREQHHQDLRRARARRHRPARSHPRRPRQVLPRDDRGVARGAGRHRRSVARDARVDVSICYLPVGSEDAAKFLRAVRHRRARSPSSTRCPSSSPARLNGRRSSRTPASRSSVTTSSRRSAPRSRTGCLPSSSRTEVSSCSARCSSTSAATWTS